MGLAPREPSSGFDAPSAWGVEGAEIDEAAACLKGWSAHFTPLASGRCSGTIQERVLPFLRLVRVGFDADVAQRSAPDALGETDPFQVAVISARSQGLLWEGRRVCPDLLMVKKGAAENSFRLPKNCDLLVARLDRRRLEALLESLGGSEPLRRGLELRCGVGSTVAEVRGQLEALLRDDFANRTDAICHDLYQRVALALAAPRPPDRLPPENRRRALHRAEEYMEAHARERISLADLCAASECSERTLRNVFHEFYGTSPMIFLKRLRLQGLHQDLRDAPPRSTTVLDQALRWGFWHLGHLGRDYRSLFGETPAATLARGLEP